MLGRQLRSDCNQQCLETYSRARLIGVLPNTTCTNIAISAASRAEDPGTAQRLFVSLEPEDRDAVTYETMIGLAARLQDPDLAETYLEEMLNQGLEPGDSAWVGLIEAYCRAGQARAGIRVCWKRIGEVSRGGIQQGQQFGGGGGGTRAYNALLHACELCGEYDLALEVYETMKEGQVAPDANTRALLASCGKKGLAKVVETQSVVSALSAAAAVAAGAFMRAGLF